MHAGGIQKSHTHTVGDEGSVMMVMWFNRIDVVTLAVIVGERYSIIIASKGWRCLCEEL